MILFMQYIANKQRGGELTNSRIHSYFRSHFSDVIPETLPKLSLEIVSPFKHMFYSVNRVKKYRPCLTVVDVSSGLRNVLAVRWLKKHQMKVMVIMLGQRMTFRYNNIIVNYAVRLCENYLLKRADLIIVNSVYIENVVRKIIKKSTPIIVANPGLEIQQVQYENTEFRNRNNKTNANLLYVGECVKVKGLIYLVRAMCLLSDLNVYLNIIGNYDINSKYFKKICKIIKKNKLNNRIIFHGFIKHDELKKFYLESSIYILPSLSEGYGKTLAEALCFGLPIVASKAGAIPEMVTDKINAILVKPGDSHELADGIRQLIMNNNQRESMSRANLEKAKNLPTWDDFDKVLDEQLAPIIRSLVKQ